MKVIVDSNILFSAAITPSGKIADLILNPRYSLEKVCCYYVFIELFKHQSKIIALAKQSPENTIVLL